MLNDILLAMVNTIIGIMSSLIITKLKDLRLLNLTLTYNLNIFKLVNLKQSLNVRENCNNFTPPNVLILSTSVYYEYSSIHLTLVVISNYVTRKECR